MRVAVLTPSFAGSTSCFAAVDDIHCTPQHYFNDGQQDNLLTFSHTPVLKATAAQQVATLHADAVINLCDGAWDEVVAHGQGVFTQCTLVPQHPHVCATSIHHPRTVLVSRWCMHLPDTIWPLLAQMHAVLTNPNPSKRQPHCVWG